MKLENSESEDDFSEDSGDGHFPLSLLMRKALGWLALLLVYVGLVAGQSAQCRDQGIVVSMVRRV